MPKTEIFLYDEVKPNNRMPPPTLIMSMYSFAHEKENLFLLRLDKNMTYIHIIVTTTASTYHINPNTQICKIPNNAQHRTYYSKHEMHIQ